MTYKQKYQRLIKRSKESISKGANSKAASIKHERILWDFRYVDTSMWPFVVNESLLKKLKDISNTSMMDLMSETHGKRGRSSSHYIRNQWMLSSKARHRLHDLRLWGQPNLFSLRLTGTTRIYGFLYNGNIFRVLWLDKDHVIVQTR